MTRSELEHIIRAAGAVADETRLIIIGSQAILAQFPNAPVILRQFASAATTIPHIRTLPWNRDSRGRQTAV